MAKKVSIGFQTVNGRLVEVFVPASSPALKGSDSTLSDLEFDDRQRRRKARATSLALDEPVQSRQKRIKTTIKKVR